MKQEEVKKSRLTLASMLIGKVDNIGFSGTESALLMTGEGGRLELKATLQSNLDDSACESLAIATDKPNFFLWEPKTQYHRKFLEQNLDAMLLGWCDPSDLHIPVSYSRDVWTDVTLVNPNGNDVDFEDRLNSDMRDVQIVLPTRLDADENEQMESVGTLEFPFSIMMIRELVMSHWQAHLGDATKFYQHCYTCNINVGDGMSFTDRWSISMNGGCTRCRSASADLASAVPNW